MKTLFTVLQFIFGVSLVASFSGIDPVFVGIGAVSLVVLQVFFPVNGIEGVHSADSINIGPIADELKKYIKVADGLPKQWFYHPDITLRKYAKKITKVMGEYHVPTTVMSAVVQGFKAEWTALGDVSFQGKKLNNFHLKINLPINVHEILAFYKADMMYQEDKKLQDRSIAQYIINNLGTRVVHDMELLSIDGEYDATLMNTEFGYSMKGLYRILKEAETTTIAGDADQPLFLIPAEQALTTSNAADYIIDEVDNFERNIPRRFRSLVKEIFIERFYYDEYRLAKRLLHGAETNVTESEFTMTYGGRKLVPLDSDKMGSMMFATVKDNLLDLVDTNDIPRIHDIQVQDYTIKLFGEGRGGFDVGVNQATFVRSEATSTLGLHNASQNLKFFDLSDTSDSGSGS